MKKAKQMSFYYEFKIERDFIFNQILLVWKLF